MSDPIIEAAARALRDELVKLWEEGDAIKSRQLACCVLAAVTPLIRAAALEEAAKVAEGQRLASGDRTEHWQAACRQRQQWLKDQIAAAIRALKEQP